MKRLGCFLVILATAASFAAAEPGDYREIDSGYTDTRAMAALDGSLWIVDGGTLWRVETDGSYTEIDSGYTDTRGMAALDGSLWIVDGGTLWRVETDCSDALVLAGEHVVAGGRDRVTIYRASSGEEVWSHEVDGIAKGLAVARGRLIVSTDTSRIYCFE